MKVSAIVPAAGDGQRLQKKIAPTKRLPKALLPIGASPMLIRTLSALLSCSEIKEIIVAVTPAKQKQFQKIIRQWIHDRRVRVVKGGKTRAHSVWHGLKAVKNTASHVLVHDAARPFVSIRDIRKVLQSLKKNKAVKGAILGRACVPTLKLIGDQQTISYTVNRESLWEAETPQVFERSAFVQAYTQWIQHETPVTDDASIMERCGYPVGLVAAEDMNLKVTTPADRVLAQRLAQEHLPLVGLGEDIHRLAKGRPLWVGGVKISTQLGSVGHSDGDVLLHAIVDGLLGAAGLGDIGEYFPDTSSQYKGRASRFFISETLKQLRRNGLAPQQVDAVIWLEKPKLSTKKKIITKQVAKTLGLKKTDVNIKAKTAEGLGSIGKQQAIGARALVTLQRV